MKYGVTLLTPTLGPGLDDYAEYLSSEYDPREGLGEYEGFEAQSAWDAVEFARDSQAYIAQEESMGFLKQQFQSYRSWWEILGLSYNMTNAAQAGKFQGAVSNACCDGWERIFGVPKLGHLIQMTRDAQLSYVNGIQEETNAAGDKRFGYSDIEGIEWNQLQFFYADIITAREDIWRTLIDQLAAGTTTRTPLELQALQLAEKWKGEIIAGGTLREAALADAGISEGSVTKIVSGTKILPIANTFSPSITRPGFGSILPSSTLPPWMQLTLLGGSLYIGINYLIRRKK